MRPRLLRRLNQLVHNVLRRRPIRISHPEVDNVFAALACRCLQLRRYVEHICRQPLKSSKLFHSPLCFLSSIQQGTALHKKPSLIGIGGCENCESSFPAVEQKCSPIPRDATEPRCPRRKVAEERNLRVSLLE